MKVAELLDRLSQLDPSLDVRVQAPAWEGEEIISDEPFEDQCELFAVVEVRPVIGARWVSLVPTMFEGKVN